MFGGPPKGSTKQWDGLVQAVADNKPQPLKQFIAQTERAGEALERIRDKDGRSLLQVAAFEGSGDALAVLLKVPRLLRKINSADRTRRTPLHLSAAIGDEVCVRSFVSAGALLDPQDEWGCTPLHLAIKFEQLEVAKALLELGADPSAEDLKGDNAVDMARSAQDGEVYALLMVFEPRKRASAWKCLMPKLWGSRRQRKYEDNAAAAQGLDSDGLPPPLAPGPLPVAQRLAGNSEHQGLASPTRRPAANADSPNANSPGGPASGSTPGKGGGKRGDKPKVHWKGEDLTSSPQEGDPDTRCPPPPPYDSRRHEASAAAAEASWQPPPRGAPLSTAIAEAARARSVPPPLSPAANALGSKSVKPAEMGEDEPRIVEWHGLEPVYASRSEDGPCGESRAPPPLAPIRVAARQEDAGDRMPQPSSDDDYLSSEGSDSADEIVEKHLAEAAAAQPGFAGPFRFQFLFDESVARLGFEVAWNRCGEEEMEPYAGAVQKDGEAARCGVKPGDEIAMCGDTATEGKVRAALIPLLKQRPLLLKVDRMLRLEHHTACCVAAIVSIPEDSKDLGIRLARAGDFPSVGAVRPGSAAEAAGMIAGDAIVAIGAQSLLGVPAADMKEALQKRPLLMTLWRLPLGVQQWPEGFEAWESKGLVAPLVDLRVADRERL